MLNDIFATSMTGRFETTRDGEVVERGNWSYRGYGNAEITMTADAETTTTGVRYDVRLHSAERQVDEFFVRESEGDRARQEFRALVAGHTVSLSTVDAGGATVEGTVQVPDETIYDGPSPVWLIHLVMTAPPPTDKVINTPVVRYDIGRGELVGGAYIVSRNGNTVFIQVVDDEGNHRDDLIVELAEDGCPRFIRSSGAVTEIVRIPIAAGATAWRVTDNEG